MSHFLQSAAWERLQHALGRQTTRLSGDGFQVLAILQRGRMNSRLYAPYGPELENEAALPAALAALTAEAKRLGAAFVRVEPTLRDRAQPAVSAELCVAQGLRRVAREQPEHTQRVNLERSFDEVLAEMRKSNRNLHRNFAKKGLIVRQSEQPEDIEHLVRLLGDVSDRTGMHGHAADYLRAQAKVLVPSGDAKIYLVDLAGERDPIAASLVYDDADRRYYGHAAARTDHRSLSPGVILVTTMMEEAQTGGLREFDLYGVVPPDVRDHAWSGFSDFKRSFGGTQIDFSGTWELPIKRASYALYGFLRTRLEGRS